MKKFEQELADVKRRVMEMGALAEQMVAWSSDALVKRDRAIVAEVLAAEDKLDRFQIEIDSEAIRLITIYTPTAKDLRFLLMVVRINTELERIGDQAVNIAESVLILIPQPPLKPLIDIPRMALIAENMIRDALDAFVKKDAELAREVLRRDDEVDELKDQVFRELLTYMMADPGTIQRALSLILISRNLERIGDHATNIAEDVIFIAEAKDVRHHAEQHGSRS